ncbi:MAG: hypothetical protein R3D33_11335 [Hyphomicrobiaceae bacterium]
MAVICLPAFNALATMAFVDPLRAANYLSGRHLFSWRFLSVEAAARASNMAGIVSERLAPQALASADWVVISARWTPEAFRQERLLR